MPSRSSDTEPMPKSQPVIERASAAGARRTQADRTANTRAALEEVTIDLLIEHGWAAVTVIEVCSRAGVSRGAFHHHYPSLSNLLAESLRRLYTEMRGKDRPTATNLMQLFDATWRQIGNPRFKAVLEAWLAMANDPSLRTEIGPVVTEFAALVRPENVAPSVLNAEERALYLMTRETMFGLALGRATNDGRAVGHEAAVIAQLRKAIRTAGAKPRRSVTRS